MNVVCMLLFFLLSLPLVSVAQDTKLKFPEGITEKTRLVVVSDSHWNLKKNASYPDMVSSLLKIAPNLDCVFLEHPRDDQHYIDAFLKNKLSWKQYSIKGTRKIDALYSQKFRDQHPGLNFDRSRILAYFENKTALAEFSKKRKLKIFAVDSESARNAYDSVDVRSEIMADHIVKYFQSGKCHIGFLPVGNSHQCCGPISIPTLVENAGFAAVSYYDDRD